MSESTFKAEICVADRLSVQHLKKESDIHIITANGTDIFKPFLAFARQVSLAEALSVTLLRHSTRRDFKCFKTVSVKRT